jgi:translation elongation factor EF-G
MTTNDRNAKPVTADSVHGFINDVVKSPEALATLLAAMRKIEGQEKQADKASEMDRLCMQAFKKAGYGDVQPRVNVLTYSLWVQAGRKVKPGEKSIKVKSLRLFHINQTESISKTEQGEYLAKRDARNTADVLLKPSPVSAPAPVTAAPVAAKPATPSAAKSKGKAPLSERHSQQPSL